MSETGDFAGLRRSFFTALMSDCLDAVGCRRQAMPARIRPLDEGRVMVGRAHRRLHGGLPRRAGPQSL
jgi:4-hydroxy-4-methyl-2-oxoglutarate aldolase